MSSRHLVLAVTFVALLLTAAPARATVLVTPDGQIAPQPYQSWVDAAYVPTPPGEGRPAPPPPVPGRPPPPPPPPRGGVVPAGGGARRPPPMPACSPVNQGTIQLSPEWATRQVLLHELGHIFDDFMPDWARGRFRGMVLRRPMIWTAANQGAPPNEQFAEAYALCARKLAIRRQAFEGYHYSPSPRMHRKVCALVNAAGRGFGE